MVFQKVNALSQQSQQVISSLNSMNELFTFNSQQFQAIQVLPLAPTHFRKRIIRTSETKRESSVFTSNSTSEGNRNSEGNAQREAKRVRFDDFVQQADENKSSPQSDRINVSEEIKTRPERSQRRCRVPLFKKFSVELSEEKQNERILNDKKTEGSRYEEDTFRRERRLKSVKLCPKVIVPLSDRKLPKAFKMGGENLFPPLQQSNGSSFKGLFDLKDSRHFHELERRKLLVRFKEDQSLKFKVFSEDERAFTPRI